MANICNNTMTVSGSEPALLSFMSKLDFTDPTCVSLKFPSDSEYQITATAYPDNGSKDASSWSFSFDSDWGAPQEELLELSEEHPEVIFTVLSEECGHCELQKHVACNGAFTVQIEKSVNEVCFYYNTHDEFKTAMDLLIDDVQKYPDLKSLYNVLRASVDALGGLKLSDDELYNNQDYTDGVFMEKVLYPLVVDLILYITPFEDYPMLIDDFGHFEKFKECMENVAPLTDKPDLDIIKRFEIEKVWE